MRRITLSRQRVAVVAAKDRMLDLVVPIDATAAFMRLWGMVNSQHAVGG